MSDKEYYKAGGLSPLDAFEKGLLTSEQYQGFLMGNVIKYTVRAGVKSEDIDGDIDKAITYLQHLRKHLKKEQHNGSKEIDMSAFEDFINNDILEEDSWF